MARRKGVFGRQTVINAQNMHARFRRQTAHRIVMGFDRTKSPAAAMDIDQHRTVGLCAFGGIKAGGNGTFRCLDQQVLDLRHRLGILVPVTCQTDKGGPRLVDRHGLIGRNRIVLRPLQNCHHCRIKCHSQTSFNRHL